MKTGLRWLADNLDNDREASSLILPWFGSEWRRKRIRLRKVCLFLSYPISVRKKTARCGSAPVIFVMMPPPKAACLVASLGRAVQPLVHAPEAVEPTRIARIGVVNGAVL